MAVTDLTDSLPWWTRQGAGPTGGPGAAPQGAGGQPGGGNSASWLQYLSQMFGISPEQAAQLSANGANPANMPSPDAGAMSVHAPGDDDGHGTGDNPPVPPFALPPVAQPGPMTGPAGPVSNLPHPGPIQPPAAASGPGAGLGAPNYTNSMLAAGVGPGAGLNAPAMIPGPNGATTTPGAPAANAQPAPVPGPLASGGAGGQGATSNPRFVQLDQGQNTDPTGRNRGPQMTALNLGGLFGRGQPAVNPDAPAANAQPVSGPLAKGGMSSAPLSMGPLQKRMVWPKDMGPFAPDQIAGRGLKQRYR